jgi:DNA repair exonuclease SbcCD nuclease subunit
MSEVARLLLATSFYRRKLMKILCYTDNHFCEKASIVTRYGTQYTARIENQLQSINWAETLALDTNCDMVVCLGDFFDHAHLTDQELTALNDITWANLPHYFLVGNHESEEHDLQFSSTMALISENRSIIAKPEIKKLSGVELAFLPYIVESDKQPLSEYFPEPGTDVRLLFSHNDILGMQLGPVVSKSGFSIEELESVSDLCLNGHLHNGAAISNRVVNLGNLTGKDFGEDAFRYKHGVMIIDTATMKVEFIENPHAFNFYKLDIETSTDLQKLETLKNNAVLSIKCKDSMLSAVREQLETLPTVVDSRIIVIRDIVEGAENEIDISSLVVDQCAKFAECCRARLDNNEILELELAEILK